jgi:hypothetical protein
MARLAWLLSAGALVALLSCGTRPGGSFSPGHTNDPRLAPMKSGEHSLVFGYIDMGESRLTLDLVTLYQALPKTRKPLRAMLAQEGLFFFENLPLGSYQLSSFRGMPRLGDPTVFLFPRYGRNETAVQLQGPGVHFMGAYKYVKVEEEFDLLPLENPGERELLEALLLPAEGTGWTERIEARLRELEDQ